VKSGSGDHTCPASSEFGDLTIENSSYPDNQSNELMGATVPSSNPDWPYDPVQLMVDLLTRTETLDSIGLQKNLVDWMSSNDLIEIT